MNRFAFAILCLFPVACHAAGLQWPVSVPDPGAPSLEVAIWYPSHDATMSITVNDYNLNLNVARDGVLSGGHHPLIVFSHGVYGSAFSNYDTAIALADAGFIVATVTHTGDNSLDHSETYTEANIAARPRHISRMIDALLTSWAGHTAIDNERIGIFGYSAGGATALLTIGGQADMGRLKRRENENEIVTGHDVRIKAAVLVAPALAGAFVPDGLAHVTVPVQLWIGSQDTIVRGFDFTSTGLPVAPDVHLVENASHASFTPPCSGFWALLGRNGCQEVGGFDRAAFHHAFNQSVIAFFRKHLPQ